jgi:hypothetical protein
MTNWVRTLATSGFFASGLGVAEAGLTQVAIAQERGATIVGVVHDSLGEAVPDVEVRVLGAGIRARSDSRGAFRLSGIEAGPATLSARRLGYEEFTQKLRLRAGETIRVNVVLSRQIELLDSVHVKAPVDPSDSRLAGFRARVRTHAGSFITRERIDRANSADLSDLLRELPGVRIGPIRNQGRAIRIRGAPCPPLVFVDGSPASAGEFDVDIIDLRSVEGVEVYAGATEVPPEFMGPRDLDGCGVIAIWSRPARPRPKRSTDPAPPQRKRGDARGH